MTKPSLLVVDRVKKKVLTGLVTVHEAAKWVPGLIGPPSGPGSELEVVSLSKGVTGHFPRLARFARKEWDANKHHLTSYHKRLGWLKEHLVPKHVGFFDPPPALVPVAVTV